MDVIDCGRPSGPVLAQDEKTVGRHGPPLALPGLLTWLHSSGPVSA